MSGPRTQARCYAALGLYQWQLTGQDPADIVRQFIEDPSWLDEVAESFVAARTSGVPGDPPHPAYDRGLFEHLLKGVPEHLAELDGRLQSALDRPIEKVDPVERAILRLGAYELLHSPEIPYRVAINEAVDLAKLFGAEKGHRYVNGVLDRLARDVRGTEAGAAASQGPRAPCPNSI